MNDHSDFSTKLLVNKASSTGFWRIVRTYVSCFVKRYLFNATAPTIEFFFDHIVCSKSKIEFPLSNSWGNSVIVRFYTPERWLGSTDGVWTVWTVWSVLSVWTSSSSSPSFSSSFFFFSKYPLYKPLPISPNLIPLVISYIYSCLPVERTRLQRNSQSNVISMMFVWFT